MNIQSKVVGSTTILSIEGTLIFEHIGQIRAEVNKILAASKGKSFMLNLERVEKLDSAGVGLIVTVYREVVFKKKAQFGLINPSRRAKKMLESAGFTRLTKVYASEEEALKAI